MDNKDLAGAESFRPIPGYPNYHVSDRGAVFSKNRHRTLTPVPDGEGYLTVQLSRDGVARRFKLHRLVCEAFNGTAPKGFDCAHLDGDKVNCTASNLAWLTPKENTAQKRAHGTHQAGSAHPRAKLTDAQVIEIKRTNGVNSHIARDYGINETTVRNIKSGKRWSHVQ